jgi:hypothetical protein
MNILLVNQFGPASGAPTGRILGQLAAELERAGHTPRLLTLDASYGTARTGWIRRGREIQSHLTLLARGCSGLRPDGVISLTSPACLAVTAGLIARRHQAWHIHWAMDLYPDLALLLRELHHGIISRFLHRRMQRAYAGMNRLVALDEDMRQHLLECYGVHSNIIGPFPPEITWPDTWKIPHEPARWLYSGNFGRAHEINVLLQIQRKLEDRGVTAELVLQGHGPQFQASAARAAALDLRQVRWNPPCAPEQLGQSLLGADVLVVTRQADLKGLLLPSKLVTAELSGRPILWIGDVDGHTAKRLREVKRHGVFRVTEVDAIAAWLEDCFATGLSKHAIAPWSTSSARQEASAQWIKLLASMGSEP